MYRQVIPAEDILQEGVDGLQTAICAHNPQKGTLATIAHWSVRNAMTDAIDVQTRAICLPEKARTDNKRIFDYKRQVFEKDGRVPSVTEVSEQTGVAREQVVKLSHIGTSAVSLDFEIDEKGTTLGAFMAAEDADPQERTDAMSAAADIHRLFKDRTTEMDDKQKLILAARYGLLGILDSQIMQVYSKGDLIDHEAAIQRLSEIGDMPTYAKIGTILGLSGTSVQKIATEAHKNAREFLERPRYPNYASVIPTYDHLYGSPYDSLYNDPYLAGYGTPDDDYTDPWD